MTNASLEFSPSSVNESTSSLLRHKEVGGPGGELARTNWLKSEMQNDVDKICHYRQCNLVRPFVVEIKCYW